MKDLPVEIKEITIDGNTRTKDEILKNEHIKGDDRHRLTSILSVEEHEKDLSSQG